MTIIFKPLLIYICLVYQFLYFSSVISDHRSHQRCLVKHHFIPYNTRNRRQMLCFLGLYKDQNTVFIIFYQIILTVVLWSWDTEAIIFLFLNVNITSIKTPSYHGVCLSTFSFRLLYIFKWCYLLCVFMLVHASPVWCLRLSSTNKCLLTYLLTYNYSIAISFSNKLENALAAQWPDTRVGE